MLDPIDRPLFWTEAERMNFIRVNPDIDVVEFESRMGEFAYSKLNSKEGSAFIRWLRDIARRVGGETFIMPRAIQGTSLRLVQQTLAEDFINDVKRSPDGESREDWAFSEGEQRVAYGVHWALQLNVYRVWTIAEKVRNHVLNVTRLNVDNFMLDDDSTALDAYKAGFRLLHEECETLWAEYRGTV